MSFDPCFYHFKKWSGDKPEGYNVNFLGAKAKDEYVTTVRSPAVANCQSDYSPSTEEYFEWVDLLETVLLAGEEYVFMELGAGYGRWSVNAALAARQQMKSYKILAVEPEPSHFAWMKENLLSNDVDLSRCEMIEAAVAVKEGDAEFYIGNPAEWYGQSFKSRWWSTLPKDMRERGVVIGKVKTVSLDRCLEKFDAIDLVDMDIQYSELDVLRASKRMVNQKVKRLHVGTHSHEIETGLRKLLKDLGWTPRYDFECTGDRLTPRGVIGFLDGVQSWINPSF